MKLLFFILISVTAFLGMICGQQDFEYDDLCGENAPPPKDTLWACFNLKSSRLDFQNGFGEIAFDDNNNRNFAVYLQNAEGYYYLGTANPSKTVSVNGKDIYGNAKDGCVFLRGDVSQQVCNGANVIEI
ncbi:uncharacterized protein UTRI_10252 [Ustilago trichophora]|uniref:Mig1 protein n=1 Tax=Ustilago trichophora TaxID=86804 RepID=A0A5C3EK44_9BASI|nr:uncharacterized protein UTRI_10252 [Ustilago trichophora]